MVGGSDFEKIKFNLATQAHRQPGSSFKAFVLAEAIHQGISPKTIYESKDLHIPLPPTSKKPYYDVSNYGNQVRGPITIEEATEQSDNTVFVQLALDLGMKNVVDMAHKMGITSQLDPYPSTAIGGLGEGVTPLEMASAYSTFPNEGVHMHPYLIQKVTKDKDGKNAAIDEHKLKGDKALSRDEAAASVKVLRGVVQKGTASYYHDLDSELGRPSAGKTGTTENFKDAWYVGFIPQLTTSVWVGYPKPKSMVNINGLSEVNGENYPLDIFSLYMQGAVGKYPVQQFDVPSPFMNLQIKTGGRAYQKLETTGETTSETTGKTTPETTGDTTSETTGEKTTFDNTSPEQTISSELTSPGTVVPSQQQQTVQQPIQKSP